MALSSPLVQAFSDHPLGLCGRHEAAQSVGVIEDGGQRLNVLAFGVVVDVNFLSLERWSALGDCIATLAVIEKMAGG